MPAGVSWSTYLKFGSLAMLSMLAGAQTVHIIYKPLEDMDELVEVEKKKLQGSSTTDSQPSSTSTGS